MVVLLLAAATFNFNFSWIASSASLLCLTVLPPRPPRKMISSAVMEPTGVLVGDELGQIKKIDLFKKEINTFNLCPKEQLHLSRGVVSISPLTFDLLNQNFLIANKANSLFTYDALTDEIQPVEYSVENKSNLVSGQCIDDQNIVIGFKNGSIYKLNIEKALCSAKYKPNSKALNMLGIENQLPPENTKTETKKKRKKQKTSAETAVHLKASKTANESLQETETNSTVTICEPNWNVEQTYLTCFKVCNNKLATGGFNSDLKVYDMSTGQSIFAAKPTNTDWLGITHDIWLSGLDWIVNDNIDPHLIATCSRTDPCIKIYDIKERQKKPIMSINLKSLNNANNESNLPSLTSICSLPTLTSTATPSTSLVAGTTLGRMLAFDLRINTRASKTLGGFKGFGGGSIRDIKYVRDSKISNKIFSCSLDRFVRVHTFTKTTRILEKKFYIKTKPTCLYPIIATTAVPSNDSENEHLDTLEDDDEFF